MRFHYFPIPVESSINLLFHSSFETEYMVWSIFDKVLKCAMAITIFDNICLRVKVPTRGLINIYLNGEGNYNDVHIYNLSFFLFCWNTSSIHHIQISPFLRGLLYVGLFLPKMGMSNASYDTCRFKRSVYTIWYIKITSY